MCCHHSNCLHASATCYCLSQLLGIPFPPSTTPPSPDDIDTAVLVVLNVIRTVRICWGLAPTKQRKLVVQLAGMCWVCDGLEATHFIRRGSFTLLRGNFTLSLLTMYVIQVGGCAQVGAGLRSISLENGPSFKIRVPMKQT